MQSARMAMVENSSYAEVTAKLEMQINILRHGHKEVVEKDWEDLKAMGKG